MTIIDCLKILAALKNDKRGVTALEYGLVAAALVGFIGAAFQVFGDKLTAFFTNSITF